MDELLKIGAAARLLGVSVETLRRWDAKGELTATSKGLSGMRFYLRSKIEARMGKKEELRDEN